MLSLATSLRNPSFSSKIYSKNARSFSTTGGSGSCLVIAEHDHKKVLSGTLNTVSAASKLCKDITVLVAGHFAGNQAIAKQISKIEGVNRVVVADKDIFAHSIAENFTPLILNAQKHFKSNYILAPSSTFGRNILPRVAGLLDVSQISDIVAVKDVDTFVRPIYAGNALATVKSTDPIKVITVRTTAFEKAKEGAKEAEIVPLPSTIDVSVKTPAAEWVKDEIKESARPELQAARVVISGGRGLKSGKNFELLEQLADQLNAAVGASRAAVDAGFVSNDLQVGQTGKIVAPELYIAVGISGAIQHLAGMKDSKVIAAINTDAEAPIFQVADYGLVGDLFTVVPELTQILKKSKQEA